MNRGTRVTERARWSLVAVLLVVAGAGCGERVPTANELRPEGLRVGVVARPVASPLAVRTGTYTITVLPQGATLDFGFGRLVLPAGAVAASTLVSATVSGDGLAVRLEPHGLVFPPTAQPTLEFDLAGLRTPRELLQMLYLDDNNVIREVLTTSIDSNRGVGTAELAHFSTYVMGAH